MEFNGIVQALHSIANKINSPIPAVSWIAWNPTLTNLTVGSGACEGKYMKVGKTVHFNFHFKMAAGSAIGTSPTFTLPSTPKFTTASSIWLFDMLMSDYGNTLFKGVAWVDSTTTPAVRLFYLVASTTLNYAGLTATTPVTWTTNDEFWVSGTYEEA